MDKILKYYTVRMRDEIPRLLEDIDWEQGRNSLHALSPPYSLAANAKVLVLHKKSNYHDVVKIDGPGWIIDDLYKKFAGLA